MQNNFLKNKIDAGFEEERQLLEHETEQRPSLPFLSYVRPVFFTVLVSVTMIALGINVIGAVKYFMTH